MILSASTPLRPQPVRPALAVEQAIAALRSGEPAEAERVLRAHLLQAPKDARALVMLGEIVQDQGSPREAGLLFSRALQIAPAAHPVRLSLARLLRDQGEPHRALEQIELIPEPLRATFDAQVLEAALLGILGRHQPEIAIYERLVASHDQPSLWMSLGNAYKYAGRSSDAVKALRKSVKAWPGYGEGWWSLANLKTARFDARDLAAMRKALRGNPAPQDALHLHFALGKALEDADEFQQSFEHYAAGNRIRSSAFTPAQASASAFVSEAIATFDAGLFEARQGVGHEAADPIFVVGLQRSGSTLVEQILASHPLIEGTSELLAMQQLWSEFVRSVVAAGGSIRDHLLSAPAETFRAIGAEYLDRTRPFRKTDKPFFVDKLPANWMNIGLIRLALPNARIIDARRGPMACGFSNFKQHYATGVAFAYSLPSIGRFYRDYLRFMRHIDEVQPGTVHRVVNERLIEDPEREIRKLLEFVGVPFNEACLHAHRTDRSVNTPSAEQVRRPINRDGVDYWRRYEPWLGPLKQALGPALDDWEQ